MISEKLLDILLETLYSKKNTMTSESMRQNTPLFLCLLSVFYHRDKKLADAQQSYNYFLNGISLVITYIQNTLMHTHTYKNNLFIKY